jgi:squalene cyclase
MNFLKLFFILLLPTMALGQDLLRRNNDQISPQLEQMYNQGLNYLAISQNEQGCWEGSYGEDPGVVGLAVIAFLAHGEDSNSGPYVKVIHSAINYIVASQNVNNGYIGTNMYSHGFATSALAEAYGMVNEEKIAPTLKKAIELILSAQSLNYFKAWRYTPDATDADVSVTGCQLVALLTARNAGISIPNESIENGLSYLEKCRSSEGSYGYTSAGGGKPTLTAIGSLCFSLAKKKEKQHYIASLNYLKEHLNFREQYYPYYFEYYMSQALFHADEKIWAEWNSKNIKLLSTTQSPDGSWPGKIGETFNTAGALLSLALNYRFLPIYEK